MDSQREIGFDFVACGLEFVTPDFDFVALGLDSVAPVLVFVAPRLALSLSA